jgi:hypothetical protein
MAKCRICNKGQHECGGWLQRVNEMGVEGVYECRPACGVELSQDDRLLGALEDDPSPSAA